MKVRRKRVGLYGGTNQGRTPLLQTTVNIYDTKHLFQLETDVHSVDMCVSVVYIFVYCYSTR